MWREVRLFNDNRASEVLPFISIVRKCKNINLTDRARLKLESERGGGGQKSGWGREEVVAFVQVEVVRLKWRPVELRWIKEIEVVVFVEAVG